MLSFVCIIIILNVKEGFHVPIINIHPGFEMTGARECSKKLIQNDYPDIKSYTSIEEILANNIELVIVNSPVNTHFYYIKVILETI